jgi:DNA-directed RNA polymerase specialized sigma24 family protein
MAGRHRRTSRYEYRRCRPGLTQRYGVVTDEHLITLWAENRAKAVRIAEFICSRAEAEDIVSEVMLYLLEHRDFLKAPPGRAYFFKTVTNAARRRHLYAWARHVVAMDSHDLLIAEEMMARV